MKRAREGAEAFQKRINKALREETYDADHFGDTGRWLIGQRQSIAALGSLRSNVWRGTAADLAARGQIAVYPTYGWWNRRPNLGAFEKACRYALIATITTPDTDVYTSVATQLELPIVVET